VNKISERSVKRTMPARYLMDFSCPWPLKS
jgi:hypothetical protein